MQLHGMFGNHPLVTGALLSNQPQRILSWTDQRIKGYRRIVLVSQCSRLRETPSIVEATLEAFAGTNVLVIALAGKEAVALRRRFMHLNLIIEEAIPFDEVMPFADAFVTYGDHRHVLYAIQHKLPIVAAGLHDGQGDVCASIGHLNYGINLHTDAPTPAEIRDAVYGVIENKIYQENITRLCDEMTGFGPLALAGEPVGNALAMQN